MILGHMPKPASNTYRSWVLLSNPGQSNEYVIGRFKTFADALRVQRTQGGDIVKRLPNGSFTTDGMVIHA